MANTQGALSRPLKSEIIWVPCAEQLPDDDLLVLVYDAEDATPVWPAYHDGDNWVTLEGCVCGVITHWMPLPNPPEASV
jgi:hypothetical protein